MALSDEARAHLDEAFAAVKQDKIYGFIRGATKPKPEPDPDKPPEDPNTPTPPKPKDPPPDPPKGKRSLWWGEINIGDDE